MTLLNVITKACDDLNAVNIEVLDMRKTSPLVDYMVICTGRSDRQVNAIVNRIQDYVEEKQFNIRHIEGAQAGLWVLIDCGDVIAHVFQEDERVKYSLERLWGDVPRVSVDELLK